MPKALRVGCFVRVSTEAQEQHGESINVQKKAMAKAVAAIYGTVVHFFAGQEHATEGFEKKEFRKLVSLAEKGMLDAVMFYDTSRFSRDSAEAKHAIDVFKAQKVKFFVLEREFDLWNPEHLLQLGLMTVINQHYVEHLKFRSRESRIERARKGMPSSGGAKNIPYGLRYDEKSGEWSINKEEQKNLQRWWRMYVKQGKGWKEIEKIEGVDQNTLRRRVLDAGPEWVQTFKHNGEVIGIPTKVPARLTEEQIEAVKAQATLNRLYTEKKNSYILAHFVRCNHCENKSVLSGHGPKTRKGTVMRYYWHHGATRKPGCFTGIRAEKFEDEIIKQLWAVMADKDNEGLLRNAIKEALVSARAEFTDLDDERERMQARMADIVKEQRNQVAALGNLGPTAAAMVNARIEELEGERQAVSHRLSEIGAELPHVTIPDDLEQRVSAIMGRLVKKQGPHKLNDTEKQALVQLFIGGPRLHWRRKDDAGRGIFVERVDGKTLREEARKVGIKNPEPYFRYTIKGALMLGSGAIDAPVELDDPARDQPKLRGVPDAQALVAIAEAAHLDAKRRDIRARS